MTALIDTESPAQSDTPAGSRLLQLIGEPFLFAKESYGDELMLHFGERTWGPVRKTRTSEFRYEHGTHRLHTRGSAWLVKRGPHLASCGVEAVGTPNRVGSDPQIPITPAAVVVAADSFACQSPSATGFGIVLKLSDGSTAVVIPTASRPPEQPPAGVNLPELADWELVTPVGRLTVGPGRKWHWAEPGEAVA